MRHHRTATLCAAAAAVALGRATTFADRDAGTPWLAVALIAVLATVVAPRWRWIEDRGDETIVALLGVGLAFQFGDLLTHNPGIHQRAPWPDGFGAFTAGLAVAAVLVGAGLSPRPWLGRWRMPLLLAVHILLGARIILDSPFPVNRRLRLPARRGGDVACRQQPLRHRLSQPLRSRLTRLRAGADGR